MICDSSATGTTISTARRSSPFCSAHSAATCSSTTPEAITRLRFTGTFIVSFSGAGFGAAPSGVAVKGAGECIV